MEDNPIVIDNGSYEVKFGPAGNEIPFRALNAIAKDKYGAAYLGNQIKTIKDISSVTFRRPHEFGNLISWDIESRVWDYCLYNPDEFDGYDIVDTSGKHLVTSETCMTIPELSKNMDQVMFEEYEFASVFKNPVAAYMPFMSGIEGTQVISGKDEQIKVNTNGSHNYQDFQLVVDSGFNCTWVIPIIKGVPYYKAVKKMEVGGRFLDGLLKETISFRHYNVMDENILVQNIKEKCLFVSPVSYFESFRTKEQDAVEYVLPDFKTSFLGFVKEKQNNTNRSDKDFDEKLDEAYQTIKLEDEQFSVPETFFHPEMAKILKPGIVEAILESLSIVPEALRPILVSNMVCIGGNFNLPHFATRLASELQRQLPTDWTCRITHATKASELFGWKAMAQFAQSDIYTSVRVTREEYYEHGVEWCTKHRFGYQNWM